MAENFADEMLTEDGQKLIKQISDHLRDGASIEEIEDEFGVKTFRGGSLGRIVLPFPDEFLQDGFNESTSLETSYVLKVAGKPLPHNYREINVWEKAVNLGWEHESLFAPIDAWDGDEYKWLLMRRAIPVSPVEGDVAYLLSGQEYVVNPDVPDKIEERLNELGWTVEDVEMNIGMVEDGYCMMDYGGVDREEDSIETPDWI